jgi:hypothetical protein
MTTGRGSLVWLVHVVLAVTGLFLAVVAVEVVRAGGDLEVRRGLDYEHFLAAVDELLDGAGDSALVRFESVEASLPGGRRVAFDTLVVEADLARYPSFREAGFLFDQVQSYNRFQRERIALARVEGVWFDRLEAFNPSVFRSHRREDGSKRLARSAGAWALRVRSPLEGEWEGEIRGRDVFRGSGLVGQRLAISLRRPTVLTSRVEGRRQRCEFTPSPLDVRAYCLSEQRIPQAILRMASERSTPERAVAGWTDLWVDGSRISAGDSVPVRAGSVLQIDPLEPLLLAEHWEGVLSSRQWVNGRTRRVGAFEAPLDLFAALGTRADLRDVSGGSTTALDLTVDATASGELTELLTRFVEDRVAVPLDFGIVIVGRVPDGEILAIGEIGTRRSRGRSNLLEPLAPGSAVKPIITAAILSERPELATLRIPARSGAVARILGLPAVPSRRVFRTSLNCGSPDDGWVDLRYFLRCSNNEYAASLLMAGLWDAQGARLLRAQDPGRGAFSLSGRAYSALAPESGLVGLGVARSTLLRSPLSEGLRRLFELPTDPVIADATRRSRRVWEGLTFSDGHPVRIPYEVLPAESRPALLSSAASESTDLSLLYRYAYGAWENRWTLLDLTNAFGRVVTDRKLQLRFSQASGPAGEEPWKEPLGLKDQPWYSELMGGLRDVPRDGTARGLATAWRRDGLPSGLFVKTGTLTEAGRPGSGDDLFIKSLVFAVGPESDTPGRPVGCGAVGGIYLRFDEGPRSGSMPSYQVEFARRELGEFLQRHWERFDLCPSGGSR